LTRLIPLQGQTQTSNLGSGVKGVLMSILRETAISILEFVVLQLFFWETDPKIIGKLVRFIHHTFMTFMGIVFILLHTFFHSYWYFLAFYIICAIIWLQHLVLQDCIITSLEQKFIGDDIGFLNPILEAFHIPLTKETTTGVMYLGSSTVFGFLTLELISRTSILILSWF
jgi:hypothetical protein